MGSYKIRATTDDYDIEEIYGRNYENGMVNFVDFFNVNIFSILQLDEVRVKLGYKQDEPSYYHFLVPRGDLDTCIKALCDHEDLLKMIKFVYHNKVIDVYMEHGNNNFESNDYMAIVDYNEVVEPISSKQPDEQQ
ncbi:hypothetical protein R6Q57_030142, partial [Mikania cordata]